MQDRQLTKEMELRKIRLHILENVEHHPRGLPVFLQEKYGIRRVYIYIELRRLIKERILTYEGYTRAKIYSIVDADHARAMCERLRPVVAKEQKLLTEGGVFKRSLSGLTI